MLLVLSEMVSLDYMVLLQRQALGSKFLSFPAIRQDTLLGKFVQICLESGWQAARVRLIKVDHARWEVALQVGVLTKVAQSGADPGKFVNKNGAVQVVHKITWAHGRPITR